MNPSDHDIARAETTLRGLLLRLRPASLAAAIDEPIDRAAQAFTWPAEPVTSPRMAEVLASFLQHLRRHAFPARESLTRSRARDELITLLQEDGGDPMSGGYIGAVLDAVAAGEPCWEALAARVLSSLKSRLRQQYVRWALLTELDPHDWVHRCALTTILIHKMARYLPAEIAAGPAERWANHLHDLLGLYLGLQDPGTRAR